MEMDLELKELGHYYGTEQYHRLPLFRSNITDGIVYIIKNGYSWLVTDSLAVIEHKIKDEDFISVKLLLNKEGGATMKITDGNEKVLHSQVYSHTDAKMEIQLYWTNSVLMISNEY